MYASIVSKLTYLSKNAEMANQKNQKVTLRLRLNESKQSLDFWAFLVIKDSKKEFVTFETLFMNALLPLLYDLDHILYIDNVDNSCYNGPGAYSKNLEAIAKNTLLLIYKILALLLVIAIFGSCQCLGSGVPGLFFLRNSQDQKTKFCSRSVRLCSGENYRIFLKKLIKHCLDFTNSNYVGTW